jgi:outer membrane biosynthesis protein TonB
MEDTQTLRVLAESDERELRDRVEREEQILEEFERELGEVEQTEAQLAGRSPVYEALQRACDAINELDELESIHLFFSQGMGPAAVEEHLEYPRENLQSFRDEEQEVERRRTDVLAKIEHQNNLLDRLHYELRDAIEVAESRRDEWIVERDPVEVPYRAQIMPWARGTDEDQRFRYSLAASILCCVLLGWLISVTDLPILERDVVNQVPERVAKLVRKELPPPEPEPEPQPVEAEEEPEPEPEQLAEETPPPEPKPEVVQPPEVIEPPKVAETGTAPTPEETREQVKSKGILAFRDSFAQKANRGTTARLGSNARVSNAGEDAVGRPERMMVTTSAPGSSGGINLASISRDVGGDGTSDIGGVEVSRVASSIGGAEGPDRPLSAGAAAGRTDEEIQIVFDRYKAALYRMYNRELRKNPTLRGQLVIRLTIEPDGSVSMCELQSSNMDAPMLADQVVDRVRTFDFGAKEDIVSMTIIYPIDFLPNA